MSHKEREHRDKVFDSVFSSQIKSLPKNKIMNIGVIVRNIIQSTNVPYKISTIDECCSMSTVSYYAIINGQKTGEPICDRIGLKLFENSAVYVVADGCGWGTASCKAAEIAIDSVFSTMNCLTKCENVRDVGELELKAVKEANEAILRSDSSLLNIGTTTLLIIAIVPLETGSYNGIYCSIGDCSAYNYNSESQEVNLLCGKILSKIGETRNCGGKLGSTENYIPGVVDGVLGKIELKENDIIMVMTDGIHHNLNPYFRKMLFTGSAEKKGCQLLKNFIESSVTFSDITENVLKDVYDLTQPSRIFLKTHPKTKLPESMAGKLDHASFGCIRVGSWINKYNSLVSTITPPFFNDLVSSPWIQHTFFHQIKPSEHNSPFVSSPLESHSARARSISPKTIYSPTIPTEHYSFSPKDPHYFAFNKASPNRHFSPLCHSFGLPMNCSQLSDISRRKSSSSESLSPEFFEINKAPSRRRSKDSKTSSFFEFFTCQNEELTDGEVSY
ncbi:hypothetical protein EDI_024420 [Entamoeba dispar SAW760]|uniref:PPM-type phosphatase domain-containing protein n=1 Tax=Entamoeba dispar (strain ATCC PRA-260 / SAW760) TaxID=370354 RepID=B0EHE9_ENTDS|nr:uncharacterized protein EDI_024420 [Entamoeba dispar SAW760]EDR26054.1 hypothetical protein EDI_024420 [Entamoeba dispar SAW760]|eukprot:EDR26054.1 hypothetical protein EDI_024420 [Entamoeba dispar SAW760]